MGINSYTNYKDRACSFVILGVEIQRSPSINGIFLVKGADHVGKGFIRLALGPLLGFFQTIFNEKGVLVFTSKIIFCIFC